MEMIRIGAVGLIGVLLAVFFRTIKAEYGVYIGMITGLLLLGYTAEKLSLFMEELQLLQSFVKQENSFFRILMKALGITYICEFCAGICKDAGYGAIGGQIELFGKVLVLLTGLPVLLAVLQTIQQFKG